MILSSFGSLIVAFKNLDLVHEKEPLLQPNFEIKLRMITYYGDILKITVA